MGAHGRTSPNGSDWSDIDWVRRPMVSYWSGGVGLVCGMKRGISLLPKLANRVSIISKWSRHYQFSCGRISKGRRGPLYPQGAKLSSIGRADFPYLNRDGIPM
jgi:hypothetical protein